MWVGAVLPACCLCEGWTLGLLGLVGLPDACEEGLLIYIGIRLEEDGPRYREDGTESGIQDISRMPISVLSGSGNSELGLPVWPRCQNAYQNAFTRRQSATGASPGWHRSATGASPGWHPECHGSIARMASECAKGHLNAWYGGAHLRGSHRGALAEALAGPGLFSRLLFFSLPQISLRACIYIHNCLRAGNYEPHPNLDAGARSMRLEVWRMMHGM